jgi:hypothetical protein
MKRAMFLVVAVGAALGLAACGGGSSGALSSPSDAMSTFASAVQSGDYSAACAVAEPSQRSACTKALSNLTSEKVKIKKISYTISNVTSTTAEVKLRITACEGTHCETSNSSTGELVKQNGNWYVSNSTGPFGSSGSGSSGSGNSGSGNSGSGNSGNS